MTLFTLRYRKGTMVMESLLEAKSLERADLVGKAFCALHPEHRFISVRPAVLADESILEPESKKKSEPAA